MSYGRRVPGMVRRGRRTYNRTSRLGNFARKALRRGLPVRKRLLRSKAASSRPLKKRRTQTRSVAWSRGRSPFKVQREIIATSFRGNATQTNVQSAVDSRTQLFSLCLSPRAGTGVNDFRLVKGSKAKYVGCNIKGTLNIKGDFIVRVVQCLDPDVFAGFEVNMADSHFTSNFWKKQAPGDSEYLYADLDGLSYQDRMYAAINNSRFKVLKTKYITMDDSFNRSYFVKKGFHMYIPMNATLETGRTMTTSEFSNHRSSNTMATITRMAYYKPIMLLIEPILRTGDSYAETMTAAIGCVDLSIKHSFRDSI